MGLLGLPLLLISILLAIAAPLGCLALWNRLRGPAVVKAAGRVALIITCQVTALLCVGVLINRSNQFYASWDDLLGTEEAGGGIAQAQSHGGGRLAPMGITIPADFKVDRHSRTFVATLSGPASGVKAAVRVWLPPQYDEPAYKRKRFPVVELFPGFPGSSWTWFGAMKGAAKLRQTMHDGKAKPFILVAPTITVQPGRDTECADVPGGPRVATWLAKDVRDAVIQHFRALPEAASWGTMGYSTGGFCAAKIAEQYPDKYRAGVSLAGYFRPTSPDLTKDAKLTSRNSPVDLLAGGPPVELLLAGSRQDPGTVDAIKQMTDVVREPTKVFTYIVERGGHNVHVWQEMLPKAYEWLGQRLGGPR